MWIFLKFYSFGDQQSNSLPRMMFAFINTKQKQALSLESSLTGFCVCTSFCGSFCIISAWESLSCMWNWGCMAAEWSDYLIKG